MREKLCTKCKKLQPIDEYGLDSRSRDGYRYQCNPCRSEAALKYYYANHETLKEKGRQRDKSKSWITNLMRNYGLSLEEFKRIEAEQNGVCYLCGGVSAGKRLCVDHNHDTGEVRRLLCTLCNTAIGALRHDPALLRKAAEYLETDHGTSVCRDFRSENLVEGEL